MIGYRTIQIPHFLHITSEEEEGIRVLVNHFRKLNVDNLLLVTGKKSVNIIGNRLSQNLSKAGFMVTTKIVEGNQKNDAEIDCQELAKSTYAMVIGVGGGKVLDRAKYMAARNRLPFVSVPTVISNDAICSPIAVLKDPERKNLSLGAKTPIGILVFLNIVRAAPIQYLRSGVGELMSNISAVEDWRLAKEVNGEAYDDFASLLSTVSAKNMQHLSTSDQHPLSLTSEETLRELVEGLTLSGIAMEISGTSRPCSGGEHKISHSLDFLYGGKGLHGEQVALGSIITAYLRGADWQKQKLDLENFGLEMTLEYFQLTKSELVRAIIYAPNMRQNRFTILEQVGVNQELAEKAVNAIW